jgi:hypothetical protein
VDDTGAEVPQTEVASSRLSVAERTFNPFVFFFFCRLSLQLYVHHWLIYDLTYAPYGASFLNGGLCPNLQNIWGIGAELRGDNYTYPEPLVKTKRRERKKKKKKKKRRK